MGIDKLSPNPATPADFAVNILGTRPTSDQRNSFARRGTGTKWSWHRIHDRELSGRRF